MTSVILKTLPEITQHTFLEYLHPGTGNSPTIEGGGGYIRLGFINVFEHIKL